MQNPSSSVSSGTMSPAIVGSDKGTEEVYVIGGVVLGLAIVVGSFWYYSGQGQSYVSKTPAETLSNAQVTNVLKTSTIPPIEPIMHNQTASAASHTSDSIHTDIYFEVGRKGLTDDSRPSSPHSPTWPRTILTSAFSSRAIPTSRSRSATTTSWD